MTRWWKSSCMAMAAAVLLLQVSGTYFLNFVRIVAGAVRVTATRSCGAAALTLFHSHTRESSVYVRCLYAWMRRASERLLYARVA